MRQGLQLLWALILCTCVCQAQEHPPISVFTPDEYKADNQNWMIDQDDQGRMLVANNEGLLYFNGASWRSFPSPNESIMRSVKVIDEKIYSGQYMDFGIWQRNAVGDLVYQSLADKVRDQIIEDSEFWNILQYDSFIVFQSLKQLFVYNTSEDSFTVITPDHGVAKVFKISDRLLIQSLGHGLYEIENAAVQLLNADENIQRERIINILDTSTGLLLITETSGLFQLELDGGLKQLSTPIDALLKTNTIYSALALKNGTIALGTIGSGLLVLDERLELLYHVKQESSLPNNTVLSLFEDRSQNLWMGLDYGISCVNLTSPFVVYQDATGVLGTVYDAQTYQGRLYLGTNQGLFYKDIDGAEDALQFVPGTEGQVWSLTLIDGVLFCGHHTGTFIIDETGAQKVSTIEGTWAIRQVPDKPNLVVQGNYNGLHVLQKEGNTWRYAHAIEGFNNSAKHFEFNGARSVFVSHEYKGVFEVELNENLTKATSVVKREELERGKHASVVKHRGRLLYVRNDGVYQLLDSEARQFQKDSLLSEALLNFEYNSGNVEVDDLGNAWLFVAQGMLKISEGKLSNEPLVKFVALVDDFQKPLTGYENVLALGNEQYLFGVKDGYFKVDFEKVEASALPFFIEGVAVGENLEQKQTVSLDSELTLHAKQNNLEFSFGVPSYQRFEAIRYQYRLLGLYDEWSEATDIPLARFHNLPHGDYTLEARAIGNQASSEVIRQEFVIQKPWFLSYLALVIYGLLFLGTIYLVHRLYQRSHDRQRAKLIMENERKMSIQHLKAEQDIMQLKNQQLSQDVASKGRELAAITMNMINKNELLVKIKEDLTKNGEPGKNIASVVKVIEKNINEEDNWNFFREAFNNADKDFLKKVKELHPGLTPNDLRLCAYLRLNLSSKEIAPLLNITPRSVEIKRYRLRKKINLPHEESLVEYILAI